MCGVQERWGRRGVITVAVLGACVVCLAGGVIATVSVHSAHERQPAASRAQLERVCGGLLPHTELDRYLPDDDNQATATLSVPCPRGTPIRGRTAHTTLVSVSLPLDRPYLTDLPKAESRLVSRTALHIADWVSERRGCGGPDLGGDRG